MSSAQIAACLASAMIAVLLPATGMLYLHTSRRSPSWRAFLAGAATFILFAMVLESILHNIVFRSPVGPLIQNNLWLYALYGGLAAGLFEETGRLNTFKLILKKADRLTDALCYGFGHGGIEAVLLVGATMIANIIIAGMAARGDSPDPALAQQAELLLSTPAPAFLWAGVERISAFCLHTALSVLVFLAVKKGHTVYYVLAIALHALTDMIIVLLNSVLPIFLTELLLAVFVVCTALLVRRIAQKEFTASA